MSNTTCPKCGAEMTPYASCENCAALAEWTQLARESVAMAVEQGKHVTCRFDPATSPDVDFGDQSACGWTGPAADLDENMLCPNGHGGNNLTFHDPGEPVEPLPPRWTWSCPVCGWGGDTTDPTIGCLNCGSKVEVDRG